MKKPRIHAQKREKTVNMPVKMEKKENNYEYANENTKKKPANTPIKT